MTKIACDSTADLLNEVYGTNLYAERNITVVPLFVRIDDEEYADGVDITMTQLLERCTTLKTLPKTAAPEVERLANVFRELTQDGSDLVFITISSDFSYSCCLLLFFHPALLCLSCLSLNRFSRTAAITAAASFLSSLISLLSSPLSSVCFCLFPQT